MLCDRRKPLLSAITALCLGSWSLSAVAELTLHNFWVRAMPPTSPMTAGYGTLSNTGELPISIETVSTDFAGRVEIHSTRQSGDQMRMERLESLTIEPGQTLELTPGGIHLMIMQVKAMPRAGDDVALCFSTTSQPEICTQSRVLRDTPKADHDGHAHHGMQH